MGNDKTDRRRSACYVIAEDIDAQAAACRITLE